MQNYDDLAVSISNQLKKEFHKHIFQDAMTILELPNVKTKFTSFATHIRELTREVFKTLAPDSEVESCEWYEEPETAGNSKITRVQRMTYAIKGGLSNQFIEEELGINFDNVTTKLNQVIGKLNKYTHINETVFSRGDEAGYEMAKNTLMAFNNFLKTITEFRRLIVHSLETELYKQVSDALTNDTIQEIDEIATHYLIESITLDNVTVSKITSSELFIDVDGSVDVEHQYGSDGDFRRGDGLRFENSYSFNTSLVLNVDDPLAVSIDPDSIQVNNSSNYEFDL